MRVPNRMLRASGFKEEDGGGGRMVVEEDEKDFIWKLKRARRFPMMWQRRWSCAGLCMLYSDPVLFRASSE